MVLYDRDNKIGELSSSSPLELHTGKSYSIVYDISFDKFLGKAPKTQLVNYGGKTAVITSIGMYEGNRTVVHVLIPGANPFPIVILVYGLAALFAGIGIYLATNNVVKIVEDVSKPSGLIVLGAAAFIYFKFFRR
jgi:hypothetical protein